MCSRTQKNEAETPYVTYDELLHSPSSQASHELPRCHDKDDQNRDNCDARSENLDADLSATQ